MLKHRVIPVLLWDGTQAVQTTKFGRPARPVGSMMQHIEVLERRNLDELIILDIEATNEGREPLYKEIEEFTSKIFCPLAVGGGIRDIRHIKKLLNAGADKVVIRTKTGDQEFIEAAIKKFGRQAIVFDVPLNYRGYMPCQCGCGSNVPIEEMARYIKKIGPGEVIVTGMEQNGKMRGYDLAGVKYLAQNTNIPIIANGGCARPTDMREAFLAGASAVAASSMFLFTEYTPDKCKKYLQEQGYPVRL